MDHSRRPHAIQGNICPICSISHFPFCPPHPHPHPHPSAYPAPNLDPTNMIRPNFNNPGDPYYDPGYSNMNPNLPHVGNFGNVNRGPCPMQNPGYGDVDYRSNKRLRVDGGYQGLYGPESDGNVPASKFPVADDGRRLNLVHDHGGPNSGFVGDRGGYAPESLGSERSVDGRDGLEFRMGYGSRYGMERGVSNVEHGNLGNRFQYHDQPIAQYGQAAKPPDPRSFHQGGAGHDHNRQFDGYHHSVSGTPHGSNENFYGSNMGPLHPNYAPMHYDQRSNTPPLNQYNRPPVMQQPGQLRYDYGSPRRFSEVRKPIEPRPPLVEGYQVPVGNHAVPTRPHYGHPHMDYRGGYGNMGPIHPPQGSEVQPPLPASPPPLPPMEPPVGWPADLKPSSSPPRVSSSLFPVHVGSSAPVHSSHISTAESHARATPHQLNSQLGDMSRGVFQGDRQGSLSYFGQQLGDSTFSSKKEYSDKPKSIDVAHLFKLPHRSSRPDHFVIILRGLPGSGKSYLAKMLRDLEVEHGGNAPRIHSMDDYFMTEVEKVEENETSKSSARFKKTTMKKVLEYCYEPEMEEAYRASMLKAFRKTLEEGAFTFVIVDDRNLRVADFAQFWATAKRSGYEVYMLEAPYKDPAGCTARNIHGFSQVDVEKMAAQWEEAPSMYIQVDAKSLFHGDDLKESNIEEVDMDTEDGHGDGGLINLDGSRAKNTGTFSAGDPRPHVSQNDERNWDAEGHPAEEFKDLGRSKWSSNLDDVDNDEITVLLKGKANVLSGLNKKKYGREGKSVYWGDQGSHTGFSIGAVKKANLASLVIGPGAGYNLKTNPLSKEDEISEKSEGPKKRSVFLERLRAEKDSCRAALDRRRRQRIGVLDAEED